MTILVIHLATLLGGALAVLLSAEILRARRPPAATLGWLLFMLLLPWLAIPLYLGLGSRKLSPATETKASMFPDAKKPLANTDCLEQVLANAGIPYAISGNRTNFHADGAQAQSAILALIADSRINLDLCIFLMADDTAGKRIIAELLMAAGRGVKVRLLLDGVGSFLLSRRRLRTLSDAGIEVAWFIPLLHRPFRGRTNLRNHRKLVIADNTHAWLGGRNLAREYFADDRIWIDLSFDIEGPAVERLSHVFAADWHFATGTSSVVHPSARPVGTRSIQVIPSGPDIPGEPLHDLLLTAIYQAQSRILAVTPYYVPDEGLQRALCLAAMRGVQVELILPRRSNHRLADIARSRYLRELVRSGVQVSLVPDSMLHAKALVVDDGVALSGSANLDLRSLFLNFELVCLFRDREDVHTLAAWIDQLRNNAADYVPAPAGRMREILEGLVLLLAFQL